MVAWAGPGSELPRDVGHLGKTGIWTMTLLTGLYMYQNISNQICMYSYFIPVIPK